MQPRWDEEIVVERIPVTGEADAAFLPSSFALEGDRSPRVVLSVDAFRARLHELPRGVRPLLVFDQFEELITLFEEVRGDSDLSAGKAAQQRVVSLLVDLLGDETLPVKLLFVFREDYLAKVRRLLELRPEVMDQSVRLTPPGTDVLYDIIRGPFETYPGRFDHELSPELATRLGAEIAARSPSGAVNLSEVQVVCLRLWSSSEPEALFEEKDVEGLLEDYLWSSLNEFEEELRFPAIALLRQMVTPSGLRNVISAEDLVARVRAEEDIDPALLQRALEALEDRTRLVRREHRRDLFLYEITSEFLVPWIRARQDDVLRMREHEKLAAEEARRRRKQIIRISTILAIPFLAVLVVATAVAVQQRGNAIRAEHAAQSQRLADLSAARLAVDPARALRTAAFAVEKSRTWEANGALEEALATTRIHALLPSNGYRSNAAAFSPDGKLVVTASNNGTVRVWKPETGHVRVLPAGGHAVVSVAFSPEGDRVLAARSDGTVRVWKSSSWKVIAELPARPHRLAANKFVPYPSAEFSPNGERILALAPDGTARLWRIETGAEPIEVRGDQGQLLNGVAFNRDGSGFVVTSDDGKAHVWNTATGKQEAVLKAPGRLSDVRAAFAPDGRVLTTGGNGTIGVWKPTGGRPIRQLRPVRPGIETEVSRDIGIPAAFSPDGSHAFTVQPDGALRLWDIPAGKEHDLFSPTTVTTGAFSPDGTLLVTAGFRGTAQVWDVRTAGSVAVLHAQRKRIYGAAFSPDSRVLVTTSSDGEAIAWTIDRGQRAGQMRALQGEVLSARITSDGAAVVEERGVVAPAFPEPLLAPAEGPAVLEPGAVPDALPIDSGGGIVAEPALAPPEAPPPVEPIDGAEPVASAEATQGPSSGIAYVRRLSGGKRSSSIVRGEPQSATDVAFSPDGRLLATAHPGGTVRIWPVTGGKPIASLRTGQGPVYHVRFSPDGRSLITGGERGGTRIWSVSTKRLVAVLGSSGTSVASASFSPDGLLVAVVAYDGTSVWNVRTHRRVFRGRIDATDAAFTPDSRRLVTTSRYAGTNIVTIAGSRPVRRGGSSYGLALSPDARMVASLDNSRLFLRVLRVGESSPVAVLHTGGERPHGVVFSADGTRLAARSATGTVRVWDIAARRLVATLTPPGGYVDSIAFSPDGRYLAVGGTGGVRMWSLRPRRVLRSMPGPLGPVADATLSPDGRFVITRSEGLARLRDTKTGHALAALPTSGKVVAVAFSSDSQRALVQSDDGTAQVWATASGALVTTLARREGLRAGGADFSPDHTRVVVVRDGNAEVFADGAEKPILLEREHEWINHATFSMDGRHVVTTASDGTARLWDAAGAPAPKPSKDVLGLSIAQLRGHTAEIMSARFSNDGKHVVTASADHSAIVWTAGGRIHRILKGHTSTVTDAVFSPDRSGKLILTTSADGTARVWDTQSGATCAVLGSAAVPIRAARFVGSARVMTLDAGGTLRSADLAICGAGLSDDLRPIAETFLRGLSASYRKGLLQRP